MNTSWRFCAPTAPPLSGASRSPRSAAANRSPTRRTVVGALVVRSTSTAPRGAASSHCPATASMAAGPGSEVNVIALSAATSAGFAATAAPAATSAPHRRGSASWTTTRCPSATRFMAIAPPMLPAPITPSRSPFRRTQPAACPATAADLSSPYRRAGFSQRIFRLVRSDSVATPTNSRIACGNLPSPCG